MTAAGDIGGQRPTGDDWDEHWSLYAESAEGNPAQAYRRRLIFAALRTHAPVERLVDIGSGQGDLARDLSAELAGTSVLGLELSASGVRVAEQKVPTARFTQVNLLRAPQPEPGDRSAATHAVCSEVLEHVDEPAALLRNATAWLRPGCRVVITVPAGPRTAFDKHIGHRRHFTPDLLRSVIEDAGLNVERIDAAGWPFFNLYRLIVLLMGERLVTAAGTGGAATGRLGKTLLAIFDALFRLNLTRSPWGWQLRATAVVSQ